jgi:hypothetical protein
MKTKIRIVKKGEDNANQQYWLTLSYHERMRELEKIRQEVNRKLYGTQPEFQRVYRITKRT